MTYKHPASGQLSVRTAILALVAVATALLIWTPGASAKTNAPRPTSSANPITYGKTVHITGGLKGSPSANMPIALQQSPFPYTTYVTIASANTSATGAYAFSVIPLVNTRFRVVTTAATPQVVSDDLAQIVNQRVAFSVNDKTPRKGALVRFYGTVTPARDGRYVSLQRRTSTGAYTTVKRIKLVDAGDSRSAYSKRIRVYKSAAYRVTMSATGSLGAGTSAKRTLEVH